MEVAGLNHLEMCDDWHCDVNVPKSVNLNLEAFRDNVIVVQS